MGGDDDGDDDDVVVDDDDVVDDDGEGDDQDRHEEGKGASSKAEGEEVKPAILPGGVHLIITRLYCFPKLH